MASPIIIDDRDPAVQYIACTSGWLVAGVEEEFDATTHGCSADGAQVLLTFTGASIIYQGPFKRKLCLRLHGRNLRHCLWNPPSSYYTGRNNL
jgi:hypothetical protein